MALLDDLKARQAAHDDQAQAAYAELVRIVAADDHIDTISAERILRDADKSPDDLAAAVAAVHHRARLRERVEAAEQASAEVLGIDAQIRAAEAELRQAQQQHQQTLARLHGVRDGCLCVIRSGTEARRELRATADPQLHQQSTRLGVERVELTRELKKAEEALARCQTGLATVRQRNERSKETLVGKGRLARWDRKEGDYEKEITTAEARLEKHRQAVEDLRERLARLEQSSDEVSQQMLTA